MLPNPSCRRSESDPVLKRILIAEDDADLRYILVHLLAETFPEAKVVAYENGRDALRDFDIYGADLVISNHSMPLMNGPTFVRHLRGRSAELPIIMVSDSPEACQEGHAVGIDHFLHKTEIMHQLVPLIHSLTEAPASV